MNVRNILLGLLLLLVSVFIWQNWGAIGAPVDVEGGERGAELLWMDLAVRPAALLVAAFAALTLLYIVNVALVRTSALMETRRWAREVESARKLADEAEASRFEQLRGELEARLAHLEDALGERFEQSQNILVAHISEFEDRMLGEAEAGATQSLPASGTGGTQRKDESETSEASEDGSSESGR